VNNDVHITSTGQSTHQDSVKKILPAAQGNCLTDNLQILTENPPPSPISFPPDFVLRAQPRPPTPASQYLQYLSQANTTWKPIPPFCEMYKTIQWIKRFSAWYWWPAPRYAIIGLCVCESIETVEEKRFYWHNPSHSAGLWRWRQTALKKQRVSLRGVYVWDVNSTVTKHLDYFVWRDTSERDSTLRRHQLRRSEWILVY